MHVDHGSERLCDLLMERNEDLISEEDYFITRLDDSNMTAGELPNYLKYAIIGVMVPLDNIGFQNVSKVILQTDQILTSLCSPRGLL